MPTIPSVFRSIRSNDVQEKSFKSYKNYYLNSTGFTTSSGYITHNAVHRKHTPHVGDPTYSYPTNSLDNTNQHVIWNSLDHRYYRYPYDPARTIELSDERKSEKFLFYSASILTAPYGAVGERIKPGSVTLTSTIGGTITTLKDDGNGNLRDPLILTSSFATASNNIFHLSFNNEYRTSDYVNGTLVSSSLEYKLRSAVKTADIRNIGIQSGVTTTGVVHGSGLSGKFSSSYIRIPHDDIFDRFNKSDDWTICFWLSGSYSETNDTILSKGGVTRKRLLKPQGKIAFSDITIDKSDTTLLSTGLVDHNERSPFEIMYEGNELEYDIVFSACNGTSARVLRSSTPLSSDLFNHILIRNSSSICHMFVNGIKQTISGSLPAGITANKSDVIIGGQDINYTRALKGDLISEFRMYDYAVDQTGINSLSNRNNLSGSLYQTNVAGNVFYRNGQVVVSSPMPKYNTGSGFFDNTWTARYKGQHTIYENNVLVRVPKDIMNVSMNPSSTFTPATGLNNPANTNKTAESNSVPGELRKSMFVSGTALPYVTTIGLYNDSAQLLAIGKLAQPIQKRDDVDMNFVVRWDY